MPEDRAFEELMARLRARDDEAARNVFDRFARRLIALAGRHLDSRLRQKVDPEDVVQSAFRSFFVRQAEGQFDLSDWGALWSLLVVITLRKCGHKVEHFASSRRDVRREQAAADPERGWELAAPEPTPEEAAQLAEAVESLMRCLDDPRERQMLELCLQGHSGAEVSTRVGRSERTVQRVMSRVRRQLERMHEQGG